MEFVEGDDLHSKENIEKMSSGLALNDQDREPWLERIRKTMEKQTIQRTEGIGGEQSEAKRGCCCLVITCSALKKNYRDILRGQLKLQREDMTQAENPFPVQISAAPLATCFVFIKGSKELILQRLQERKGHYMKSTMLDSQLDELESPEEEGDVVVIDAENSIEIQIKKVKEKIKNLVGEGFSKSL